MRMRLNPLIEAVGEPPVGEVWSWTEGRDFPPDKPLIDIAPGEPSWSPAEAQIEHLASEAAAPDSARYTEIRGMARLRDAFAKHLSAFYGAEVSPAQVSITAGCNQAFCLAMMALCQEGDEVIVPAPYYFSHPMWLEMLGVRLAPLAFNPERGGVPDPAEAAALIGARTRAIVLVTPNNPTGVIYPPEIIADFYTLAKECNLALVLDETYKDFLPHDQPPHALLDDPAWNETLVQLHSFSKSYSLAGYRIGALVAGEALSDAATKAMDCVAICAPALAQKAALYGLEHLDGWQREKRRFLQERLEALRDAFKRNDLAYELVSAGAFFAYVRHPFRGASAVEVAKRLADEQNLLCLPGSFMGPGQDDYLRISFANVDATVMPEIAARLVASQG